MALNQSPVTSRWFGLRTGQKPPPPGSTEQRGGHNIAAFLHATLDSSSSAIHACLPASRLHGQDCGSEIAGPVLMGGGLGCSLKSSCRLSHGKRSQAVVSGLCLSLLEGSGGQAWACRVQPQRHRRPPRHPSLRRVLFLFSDSASESASLASGRGCNLTHCLFALKTSVDVQRPTGSPSVTVLPVREASPASEAYDLELHKDKRRPRDALWMKMLQEKMNTQQRQRKTPSLGSQRDLESQRREGLLSRLMEWKEQREQRETAARRPRGPEQDKIICKSDKKDSQSKRYLSRLHQMYSTSLANMEFSRSLLEASRRGADVGADGRAGGLWDPAFLSGHGQHQVRPPERRPEGAHWAAGRQREARPPLIFLRCDSLPGRKKDSNEKARGHAAALGGMSNLPEQMRSKPASPGMTTAPLTLEQASQKSRVLEAKTASRYWTNYVD
ncbi:uncharacterized protein [Bos indicus]|uniref:Uncharacterized protein n=1 Tax=Bos indicus TaxID=9915 RepID=A0ABM4SVC4_BOSIN